jgi:Putative transposase
VAISNRRLLGVEDGKVTFHWKDYARGGKKKKMTLDAAEFIRPFLLHVLPKGLVRIRYYGWMANRCRRERAAQSLVRAFSGESVPMPLRSIAFAHQNGCGGIRCQHRRSARCSDRGRAGSAPLATRDMAWQQRWSVLAASRRPAGRAKQRNSLRQLLVSENAV